MAGRYFGGLELAAVLMQLKLGNRIEIYSVKGNEGAVDAFYCHVLRTNMQPEIGRKIRTDTSRRHDFPISHCVAFCFLKSYPISTRMFIYSSNLHFQFIQNFIAAGGRGEWVAYTPR